MSACNMNLTSYRILQTVLSPFIDVYLRYRKVIGKEDKKRFPERLGKAGIARPQGNLVWIHAASIGESVSVLPLLTAIRQKYPSINILMTTGTVTSAKLLEKKLPKDIIHQFVPVDMHYAVKRFVAHWRPDLAIWVESELWPNLVCNTSQTGCPMLLINARMSDESLVKWKKHKPLADNIFGCFTLCLAQNEKEADKFLHAGIKNSIAAGNLKYESPSLPSDPENTANLIRMIGNRRIWVASSTSRGEEEIAALTHIKLAEKYPDLLTIIAPRHPNRMAEIRTMLEAKGLNTSVRSQGDDVHADTQIYLADTIGELGIFYRLSNIVFMGGSLVDHGGQNPLEPARLNCAILSGPTIYNFEEIYADMKAANAVIIVNNKDELLEQLDQLLSNSKMQDIYADHASHFIESKTGVIDNYLKLLDPYLKPLVKYVS